MEKIHGRVSSNKKMFQLLLFDDFSMKYVRALEYVLQNAPVRAKEPEKKVLSPSKIALSKDRRFLSLNRKKQHIWRYQP